MTAAWKRRRAKPAEPEPTRAELPKREDARTPEDIKNGWSYEAWAAHHDEVAQSIGSLIAARSKRLLPAMANGRNYSRHRWLAGR